MKTSPIIGRFFLWIKLNLIDSYFLNPKFLLSLICLIYFYKMKNFKVSAYFMGWLFLASCAPKDSYNPEHFFSHEQQRAIIEQNVRYAAKLPPDATHANKFDPTFNWYYKMAASECDWRACAIAPDGRYYFLMTRKARSIWPAREAIGGVMKVDKETRLQEYEEVFRTRKMSEDSLNHRAFELFDLMVKGKDLTPYYSINKGDRYIEFPDDRFFFDKKERKWKDRAMDSIQFQR